MNQAQRSFLVKKIQDTANAQVKALESLMPEAPSLEKYLLNAVMSEKFELQPLEHIRKAIIKKALNLKSDKAFLGDGHWGKRDSIYLKIEDLFVIPELLAEETDQYHARRKELDEQIQSIRVQADTLITRIQLASDKTLQTMINEVDDMGNLSLMDTKIKALSGGTNKELKS